MIASVNLKLSTTEFDLVREALTSFREANLQDGANPDLHPRDRREAKATVLKVDDLLRKLA